MGLRVSHVRAPTSLTEAVARYQLRTLVGGLHLGSR
jgi:hypothetical protein